MPQQQPLLDTIIIGGGISGLSAAWALKKKGLKVRLLEAKSEAGGWLVSENLHGCIMDHGAGSFRIQDQDVIKFMSELGLNKRVLPAQKLRRFIAFNNSLHAFKPSFKFFFNNPFLSASDWYKILREPWIQPQKSPNPKETVADFLSRRFGDKVAKTIGQALCFGTYAAPADTISLERAFPNLAALERDYGSIIRGILAKHWAKRKNKKTLPPPEGAPQSIVPQGVISFPKGSNEWITALSLDLEEEICLSTPVRSIRKKDDGTYDIHGYTSTWSAKSVILATPAWVSASILQGSFSNTLNEALRTIPYTSLLSVWIAYPKKTFPKYQGFGFLIAKDKAQGILGSLWPYDSFPAHCEDPDIFVTRNFYRTASGYEARHTENHLITATVHSELKNILGPLPEPLWSHLVRCPDAIPNPIPETVDAVEKIKEEIRMSPGLFVCGNYLSAGVALESVIKESLNTAHLGYQFLSNKVAGPK